MDPLQVQGCRHRKVHRNVVTDCGLWNGYVHDAPCYFTMEEGWLRVRCPACFIRHYQAFNKRAQLASLRRA
jgi:hypothetical protein